MHRLFRPFYSDKVLSTTTAASTLLTKMAASQHTPSQTISLDAVPEDIHDLIFAELSKSAAHSVRILAQTSRTMRRAALPFLYKNLVLEYGQSKTKTWETYEALKEVCCGDENPLYAKFVRNIVSEDNVLAQDLIIILNKTSNCGVLCKLRYSLYVHHLSLKLTYLVRTHVLICPNPC